MAARNENDGGGEKPSQADIYLFSDNFENHCTWPNKNISWAMLFTTIFPLVFQISAF